VGGRRSCWLIAAEVCILAARICGEDLVLSREEWASLSAVTHVPAIACDIRSSFGLMLVTRSSRQRAIWGKGREGV
jgi:hypothetical protein